ncbi:hypothetical protein ACF0H5_010994 [Mactra antiquata]
MVRECKTTCPGNGSEIVYKGFAAGSHYDSRGGASTYLCLPEDPTWNRYEDQPQRSGKVWGAEYEFLYRNQQNFFGKDLGDQGVPCCVCSTSRTSRYELSDGQSISVGDELFLCNEGLFKPELLNVDSIGIHDHVFESLMQCDIDTRRDILANVIIAGGTSLTSGFSECLRKELEVLCSKATRVKIAAVPERKMSSWFGGSILALLSSFQSQWISKCEYEEFGPYIIHKNCHDL